MSLTTPPTGLGHGVYNDAIVCAAVFSGAWNIGRIYERRGFSAAVRFLSRPKGLRCGGRAAYPAMGPALTLQIACGDK
jgi:hypothetical protein